MKRLLESRQLINTGPQSCGTESQHDIEHKDLLVSSNCVLLSPAGSVLNLAVCIRGMFLPLTNLRRLNVLSVRHGMFVDLHFLL